MAARAEAEREGIQVPLTLEDYCIKTKVKSSTDGQVEMTDFYDDDYDEDYDEPSDDGSECAEDDENDSGNGES